MNRTRCLICDALGWWEHYIVTETDHGRRNMGGVDGRKLCPDCAAHPPATYTVKVVEVRQVNWQPETRRYVEALRRGERPMSPWAQEEAYEYGYDD